MIQRFLSRAALPCAALLMAAAPLAAQELPTGLASARILPGWANSDGSRTAAIELVLEPGWKTYWRSPGDSGLPPEFDWTGSDNLADVDFHWPAPQAIRSGGTLTMGYHDRLVLPFTATPRDVAQPVSLHAAIDLGLCEKICVPAHLRLSSAHAVGPDAAITAALADVPQPVAGQPLCHLRDIEDGVQVRVTLPDNTTRVAALELNGAADVWVSGTVLARQDKALTATADFVPPAAAPFDLDPQQVRLTLIGPDGATEMQGCTPAG